MCVTCITLYHMYMVKVISLEQWRSLYSDGYPRDSRETRALARGLFNVAHKILLFKYTFIFNIPSQYTHFHVKLYMLRLTYINTSPWVRFSLTLYSPLFTLGFYSGVNTTGNRKMPEVKSFCHNRLLQESDKSKVNTPVI